MRPFLTALVLCLIAPLAMAADLPVFAPVSEVTVYPSGAKLTRRGAVQVTPGQHRLVISDLPADLNAGHLRVQITGAHRGAMTLRTESQGPARTNEHRDVTAARTALRAAETALAAAQDRVAEARLAADAADTRLRFLAGLGRTEGAANASPERLRALSELVGQEALAARQGAHAAQIAARVAERDLPDLETALQAARARLENLAPRDDAARSVLTIEVDVDQPGEAEVVIINSGFASWHPVYDIHLSRGASPTLEFRRGAVVSQDTGEIWRDVRLTLSTLQPTDQIAPSDLYPLRRRAVDPAPPRAAARQADGLAEPMIEPQIVHEQAEAITDGYALVYTYPRPITILSGDKALRVELGSLTTGAEVEARAVPHYDKTAFLVAALVNDTGEELLPSIQAYMYIDGDWVGQYDGFEGLTEGAKGELPFGPIRGLQVKRTVLNRSEGDTGLITRSNTEMQRVLVEVENLTGETWPLRLLDRVPYTEQEELIIDWSADPAPTETNVDMWRGILGWDILLEPGGSQRIQLDTSITWPEGKLLR